MDQELLHTSQTSGASSLHRKRKKELRRILVSAIAFVVITIVLFSAQTVAYFTSNVNSSDNRINTGIIAIQLQEHTIVNNTTSLYTTDPVSIMPATSVSKIPTVTNNGSLNVRVRMKVDLTLTTTNTVTDDKLAELDKALDEENLVTYNASKYATMWEYNMEDGYYYYKETLTPGSTTEPLFDTVIFSPAMGNDYTNSAIQFIVTAEASQVDADGNPLGWPTSSATADESGKE